MIAGDAHRRGAPAAPGGRFRRRPPAHLHAERTWGRPAPGSPRRHPSRRRDPAHHAGMISLTVGAACLAFAALVVAIDAVVDVVAPDRPVAELYRTPPAATTTTERSEP